MICKKCGKEIHDDSVFCEFCGNKIIDEEVLNCPSCGNNVPIDSLFCEHCGYKFENNSDASDVDIDIISEEASPDRNIPVKALGNKKIIAAAIAAALIIAIVAIPLFSKSSQKNSSSNEGGNTTSTPNTQTEQENGGNPLVGGGELKVINSGWSTKDDDDGEKNLFYGVEYENVSDKEARGVVDVKITAKNKKGEVLAAENRSGSIVLPPGETAVFSDWWIDVKEDPETVDIDVRVDPYTFYGNNNTLLEAVNVKVEGDTMLGEIKNDTNFDFGRIDLYTVYYDDDGKIVGGDMQNVGFVKANSTAAFSKKAVFNFDMTPTNNFKLYAIGSEE